MIKIQGLWRILRDRLDRGLRGLQILETFHELQNIEGLLGRDSLLRQLKARLEDYR
jgi:hypothetical protein